MPSIALGSEETLARPAPSSPVTYAQTGVRQDLVALALSKLLEGTKGRIPPGSGEPLKLPGHFAGIVRIGRESVALTTDNVGTKLLLARTLDRWEEVGEDVVAVNVNDLSAVGARPSALVDYIAVQSPVPSVFEALGRGIGRGLKEACCHLVGGETSVVPDLVKSLDLSGTALGFFPKGRAPVTGEKLRPGDVLLGLSSSGFHANGYTLLRRLIEENAIDITRPLPGDPMPLGERLLAPTRIYTRPVEALLAARLPLALAHISGRGLRNLIRLNPKVQFTLDALPPLEGIFRWVADLSRLPTEELYQTFNMGIGFVLAVRPNHVERSLSVLRRSGGKDARVIGRVEKGRGVYLPNEGVRYDSY
ncbi:MAG: phosphoribosylformylglycinamidine cyclo-ligase [Euryarchaeota archaeon]|nr:phosphoribosylformylglycinamidine cyclo-ligase [Euryarchaeota archaeon]MDE1836056.1 phosphoribosylformylglycinamidine cyclo-ligase [Euryarchaeota archaeon]MDE1879996.1 phosphoribosylformylglycinamidine cyclo-ligase [Euryarchaeota archaeon]MDE2044034.1 phosphoribosylformylglycinamidine cyclo-ligase [Thermoplasmata archaeon]